MDENKLITVEALLKLPQFKYSVVIAGKRGLRNNVAWSHVMEVTNCREYINGNDFILTTGAGWKEIGDVHFYVKQLIEAGAAALCIQLGSKFNFFSSIKDIPKAIIEVADQGSLPVIAFPENHECRYIDLIRDIHALIINADYKLYLEQEVFINELNAITIKPHEVEDLFYFLHKKLDVKLAYIPVRGKSIFIPNVEKHEQKSIRDEIDDFFSNSNPAKKSYGLHNAYYRIKAYNHDLAYLAVYSPKRELGKLDSLFLEKFTSILNQDMQVNFLIREKERQVKENWVSKWISGRLKFNEIMQYVQEAEPHIQPTGCVACLINFSNKPISQIQKTDSLFKGISIIRSFLEQQGFYLFWAITDHRLSFALTDTQDSKTWRARLNNALANIDIMLSSDRFEEETRNYTISIGKRYQALDQLKLSFLNAQEALNLRYKLDDMNCIYYDDLHIYRIILLIEHHSNLEEYVAEYLGPIIKYKKTDSNLLSTLSALRDCKYHKKETAEHLLIARQSLYQRIDTIKELLGSDMLDTPEKRLCIEIALYGLEYLRHKRLGITENSFEE